jgi:hypothetical protein
MRPLRLCAFFHSIHAPLIAFDDVFRAFDTHAWSEHGSKEIQLSRTESLARIRRRANRTVILDQQKATVVFLSDLGHVTFFSSDLCQRPQFSLERIFGLIRLP